MNVDSSGGQHTSANDVGQSTDIGTDDKKQTEAPLATRKHDSPASKKTPPMEKPSVTPVATALTADSPPTQRSTSTHSSDKSVPPVAQQISTVIAVKDEPRALSPAVAAPEPGPLPSSTLVTQFVSAALSPLSTTGSGAPVDAPVMLGLLAWVKNEEQRRYSAETSLAANQQGVAALVKNNPPVANNDNASTNEDTAVTIKVLANDKDRDRNALTTSLATNPANGTVTHNVDGSFTYTPNPNFNGTDTFTYTASDGIASSAPAHPSREMTMSSLPKAPRSASLSPRTTSMSKAH
jgi:hypothetical protein